ncbi:hypothetical protein E2C01_099826 [Portunus trituberculatus]|uniref:Uncharacterized protein n=1 Tax=Portunus trituberculatus TaxID=210409 RepID=A0A5B7K6I5_PORTR|nr:hypothetical protein [Portunus trituberculatus]
MKIHLIICFKTFRNNPDEGPRRLATSLRSINASRQHLAVWLPKLTGVHRLSADNIMYLSRTYQQPALYWPH